MYAVAVTKRNEHGQDVTAVVEAAEDSAAVAAAAGIAVQRLERSLRDAGALQGLADEDVSLRRQLEEDKSMVDALNKGGAPEMAKSYQERLVAAVQRREAIKQERAAIITRNA